MNQQKTSSPTRLIPAPDNRKSLLIYIFLFSFLACLGNHRVSLAQEQQTSLSNYEVIERRNFFRPREEMDEEQGQQREQATSDMKRDASEKTLVATEFMVTGIIKLKGTYKAIIEKKAGQKGYYVEVGDALEEYVVVDIQKNRLLLERNGQSFELKLKKTSTDAAPEPPSAPESHAPKKTTSSDQLIHTKSIIETLRTGRGGRR